MAVTGDHHGRQRRTNKKTPAKGSGGQHRRSLRGKGPIPKAEDRPYHKAYREKQRKLADAQAEQVASQQRAKRSSIHVRQGHQLVAGRNPVIEALKAGLPVTRVFMAGNLASDSRLSKVVSEASAQGAPVLEVPRSDLDIATDDAVHQGIAVEVPEFKYCDLEYLFEHAHNRGHVPLIVVLDNVTDPHNLGAIVRSAAAFGADGVVIPNRRSATVNVTAWKASAGAAARLPVARVSNLVQALDFCKSKGCFVIGLDAGGSTTVAKSGLADGPLVLVTGAEGDGLGRLVAKNCDLIASIPISSSVESLNASVATGIALCEAATVRAEQLAAQQARN